MQVPGLFLGVSSDFFSNDHAARRRSLSLIMATRGVQLSGRIQVRIWRRLKESPDDARALRLRCCEASAGHPLAGGNTRSTSSSSLSVSTREGGMGSTGSGGTGTQTYANAIAPNRELLRWHCCTWLREGSLLHPSCNPNSPRMISFQAFAEIAVTRRAITMPRAPRS